uniref:Sel1-like protein n=1 Tax=Davidia involucrata TaxID=16924 RepID=A0A5B7B2W5_DAVIN
MGKSPPISATAKLQQVAGVATQLVKRLKTPQRSKPISPNPVNLPETARIGGGSKRLKLKKKMENSSSGSNSEMQNYRTPLSQVVSDCVKRWFQDTLKEAKTGDLSMQVLVGQMYYSGYGVPRDAQKGRLWMTRASRIRSSVWKVSSKRPGYNASDSDSDELKGDS